MVVQVVYSCHEGLGTRVIRKSESGCKRKSGDMTSPSSRARGIRCHSDPSKKTRTAETQILRSGERRADGRKRSPDVPFGPTQGDVRGANRQRSSKHLRPRLASQPDLRRPQIRASGASSSAPCLPGAQTIVWRDAQWWASPVPEGCKTGI